jgi:hypothetical protein
MHLNQSRLGTGAAVLAGTLTFAFAASATALAGQTQGGGHAQSTALPNWYHTPLTAAQINAEVAVPKSLDFYTGPLRLTHDALTAGSGGLAVDAGQALGHALAQGEHLQLTNAFVLDGATPSAATRSELKKLAWSNVTNVTCEGYTDYGPHSFNRDQLLGRARATAICNLLHSQDSAVTTKAVTYGSTRPVKVGGPVNTHHAENRRVVIDITSINGTTAATTPVVTTPVVTTPTVTTPTINVPLAPTVSAVAGDAAVTLTIEAPSSAATITGYEYSLDGGTAWLPLTTTGTSTLTATITGLTDGTAYSVEVRADSSAGHGAASTGTSVTPSTVPGPASITAASYTRPNSPRHYMVLLTWSAPTQLGGLPITGWEISQANAAFQPLGGVTDTDGVYTATFDTGLDWCIYSGPTDYAVAATNADGTGTSSTAYLLDLTSEC